MRIAYFVPRFTPDNSHGRYVVELARRLCRDHSVSAYSGAFWDQLQSAVSCHYVPVPIRPAALRLAVLWTASAIKRKQSTADVVHVQGADAPIGNVVTAHFCNQVMRTVGRSGVKFHRRFNYAIGAMAEKYCMSKQSTRRIIAVSAQLKDDIVRHYDVDPAKVVVIHNGVDSEVFHPQHRVSRRSSMRQRIGLGSDEFVVLFVGGDYRRKGLIPLLEAAARLPPRTVTILAVGVDPDARLLRHLRQDGLTGLVKFLGHSMDMASLYAAADCFALPTKYDTFSLAALEAMASGLPTIISRAAGVAELVTHDIDCLVLEHNTDLEQLEDYLRRLARDESLRNRLAAAGRRTAEGCSWDVVAKRTLAVYRDVVGS